MFNIEIRLIVDGRPVSLDMFIETLLVRVSPAIRTELQKPRTVTDVTFDRKTDQPRQTLPLAVGVDEAARLIGLKPGTIRLYIARRKIQAVRLGRRVMVPMEALRKISAEGIPRGLGR